jgi:hypothetical protein
MRAISHPTWIRHDEVGQSDPFEDPISDAAIFSFFFGFFFLAYVRAAGVQEHLYP